MANGITLNGIQKILGVILLLTSLAGIGIAAYNSAKIEPMDKRLVITEKKIDIHEQSISELKESRTENKKDIEWIKDALIRIEKNTENK